MRLGLNIFSWVASSPARFALALRAAGLFSRVIPPFSEWLRLPAFTGWGYSRDIARPARRPFRDRFASLTTTPLEVEPQPPQARPSPQLEDNVPIVNLTTSEQVERFTKELAALSGSVTRCTADDLAVRLLEELRQLEIETLQAWDEDYFPNGLIPKLRLGGIQVQAQPDPTLRAGLTGALAGIAETGTLVLPGGTGRPLTASLLPEIHFAVLRQEDLVQTLVEALHLPAIRKSSAVVLTSGPSRTADIEMALTIGVHGPKEVRVFII